MIVIVNGPLGIGKTSVSWLLLERFPRAVLLEGDYIAAIQPFDYYNQTDLDYAYRTFGLLAAHHVAHGISNIVCNWVWESAEQLARVRRELGVVALPICTYRLWCAPDVIAERVRRRNLPNLDWELQRSRELVGILDRAAFAGDMGIPIDTTTLTPDQTAQAIWNDLQDRRA